MVEPWDSALCRAQAGRRIASDLSCQYRCGALSHGPGTPAVGTKFSDSIDPDDYPALANDAVSGSPNVVVRNPDVDGVPGNHSHEHDFRRAIGENGETGLRVWVKASGEVATMHPIRMGK